MNKLSVLDAPELVLTAPRVKVSDFRADPIGSAATGPVVVVSRDRPRLLVVPIDSTDDHATISAERGVRTAAKLELIDRIYPREAVESDLAFYDELRREGETLEEQGRQFK